MPTPRFTHDCDRCTYLGSDLDCDYYHCTKGSRPTVLARYSSHGPDYESGALSARNFLKTGQWGQPLAVAFKQA